MTFITLNRPDIITSTYAGGQKYADLHVKQTPVTINPEKIISMVEYFDDEKFVYTTINMEDSLHYNVANSIADIVEMIDSCVDVGTVLTV